SNKDLFMTISFMSPSGPPMLSSLHAAAAMCPLNTVSNASWHACMSSFGLFAFGNRPSLVKSWFSDPWSLGLILTSFCHFNYRKSKFMTQCQSSIHGSSCSSRPSHVLEHIT
ncbi:hypothetical protein EMCRGX_G004874, partial [Ephydatia muelleri]